MPTPTFLVIGAAKAGTTALWNHLAAHPEIAMARQKEPRFFTRVEARLEKGGLDAQIPRSGTWEKGWDWYEGLWEEDAPQRGEASTVYFVAPDAPALVAEHLPDARLIAVLRDPVDRMYSHYWQERRAGWTFGTFREMVEADHPRAQYFEATSHYRANLERWLAHVDRERLLVLTKDELDRDPERTLERVYRHLGVDPSFRPGTVGQRFNRQREARFPALLRGLERLRAALPSQLPGPLQALARRARAGVVRAATTETDYEPLPADLRAALVPRFEADVAYVEALTGRGLEAWRRADG